MGIYVRGVRGIDEAWKVAILLSGLAVADDGFFCR